MTTSSRRSARGRGGGAASELPLLEHQIRLINRFPDQNPHPVLRMSDEGRLLYANPASAPITEVLGASVGEPLGAEWVEAIRRCAADPSVPPIEVECRGRTYSILAVPVPEFGFVNLYGTDVTANKVVARFPDQNPNPVFRIAEDGTLIYANRASEPIVRGMGLRLGDRLPADTLPGIRARVDGSVPGALEVHGENRTYALWPVSIPEFAFINVYGTDITALKALDKFPDQNPNPVLRMSQDGTLLYANPAAAPVVEALGVAVGEQLGPELRGRIARCAESGMHETLEVESKGRIFELLVVSVFEFDFINLYGTDVTAARLIEEANRENERLLLNILPAPIADRLRRGERIIADRFDDVTLLFADIVDFTRLSSTLPAGDVVSLLNDVFSLFDALLDRHGLEKIKTIGDAYMVVGGLPEQSPDHADRVADLALELAQTVEEMRARIPHALSVRIGMHTGPAVAGVIGVRKFIYDVWGDTVNTASRMESHGMPGRIQVTEPVYERLRDRYRFEPRGIIEVRGKGPMQTWFLLGRRSPTDADERHPASRSPAPG